MTEIITKFISLYKVKVIWLTSTINYEYYEHHSLFSLFEIKIVLQ